jgi:hypothetical protein
MALAMAMTLTLTINKKDRQMGMKTTKRPVVVCTDKRGVFFGYANGDLQRDKMKLTDVRMCVYWSQDVRGVVGLAASGPTDGCRITEAAPAIELVDVHAVMDCTAKAVKAWERAPWG